MGGNVGRFRKGESESAADCGSAPWRISKKSGWNFWEICRNFKCIQSKPGASGKFAHADENFIPLHGTKQPCRVERNNAQELGLCEEGRREGREREREGIDRERGWEPREEGGGKICTRINIGGGGSGDQRASGACVLQPSEHAGQESKPQPKLADTTPPHVNHSGRSVVPTPFPSVQAARDTHSRFRHHDMEL